MTLALAIVGCIFGVLSFFVAVYNTISIKVLETSSSRPREFAPFHSSDTARALTHEDDPSIYEELMERAIGG